MCRVGVACEHVSAHRYSVHKSITLCRAVDFLWRYAREFFVRKRPLLGWPLAQKQVRPRLLELLPIGITVTPISYTTFPTPLQNAFPVSYRLVGVEHVGLENERHALQVVEALVHEVGNEVVRHLAELDQLDVVLQEIEASGLCCDRLDIINTSRLWPQISNRDSLLV